MSDNILDYYKNKNVLVTGHSGFKGSWMTAVLLLAGANVTGYSLYPEEEPALFKLLGFDRPEQLLGEYSGRLRNIYGDIRDLDSLDAAFEEAEPEIVIHMAAQPIVRTSYEKPVYTYETNVMGTVNLLECVRKAKSVKSVINVTTDKVYRNYERQEGYREDEELCGYDPYSNSKSCSELVTDSYRNSFLNDMGIAVSTMRAGNVIGGGDFAKDRIIPDCVRSAVKGEDIIVRNPYSVRPYQHVLEPVVCYLRTAMLQNESPQLASAYNIGPDDKDAVDTGRIATLFCDSWNKVTGQSIKWINRHDGGPHEAGYLKLDCSRIKSELGWKPVWNIEDAIERLTEWYAVYAKGENVSDITVGQIKDYIGKCR